LNRIGVSPWAGSKSLPASKSKRIDVVMSAKISTYAELQELIRVSLRAQNPEWVEPDGRSPICKIYEARFAKLIGMAGPDTDDEKGGMIDE
jgi:hypothetical protein